MSNQENDKLMDEFMETLNPVIVCVYCGDIKAQGTDPTVVEPSMGCCHESSAHFAVAHTSQDGEILLYDSDLQEAFKAWLADRGEAPNLIQETRDAKVPREINQKGEK